MNDWTVDKIIEWNCDKFKKNNQTKQLKKIEEEITEFDEAEEKLEIWLELADVYIAFARLGRFSKVGGFVCDLFKANKNFDKLRKLINLKMEENVTRTFDKNMHHKENKPLGIKVIGTMNNWKKDAKGNWYKVAEPFEYITNKKD